jgi:uncharacterized protein (DUF302 family)
MPHRFIRSGASDTIRVEGDEMIQVKSNRGLKEIERAIAVAAQHHNGSVLSTTHLGELLHGTHASEPHHAIVLTICQSELYRPLLLADNRFAAFLPCRIAAVAYNGDVLLEAVSPIDFCRLLERGDLERLVLPLETVLRAIMQEAAAPVSGKAAVVASDMRRYGATEDQVNMRLALAPRIDCRGTKVEELAGTGAPETLGG